MLSEETFIKPWDIVVLSSAFEDDATQFYDLFSEILKWACYEKKVSDIPEAKTQQVIQFFLKTVAIGQHKITEIKPATIVNYLTSILQLSYNSNILSNLVASPNGEFTYGLSFPVSRFIGIQIFTNYLSTTSPSLTFFLVALTLGKLYFRSKQLDEMNELAREILKKIEYMAQTCISCGRNKFVATAFDALEYVVNYSEILGNYTNSAYELYKIRKAKNVIVQIKGKPEKFEIYPNQTLRNFLQKVYKRAKLPYGSVLFTNYKIYCSAML